MTLESKSISLAMVALLFLAQASSCGHETPPTCKKFDDLSGPERERQFPTYDVDTQLDIYVCAMQRKPPISTWAYDIAKGGEKKLPAVTQRLMAEQDPVMQYHFIHLLQIMSEEPYFRGKQDVVNQVRQVISKMSQSPARAQAEQALSEIEKNAVGD